MQGARQHQYVPLWQKSVVRTHASKVKASEATFCMPVLLQYETIA